MKKGVESLMIIISSAVIGIAVAQDAFAVSVLYGTRDRSKKLSYAFLVSAVFAMFQMLMPVLGWSVGKAGSNAVKGIDNILAFGILTFIGIKMMIDAKTGIDTKKLDGRFDFRNVLFMAFATSIDAMTIGITLPVAVGADNFVKMLIAVLLIGGVTFVICLSGYLLGRRFSDIDPVFAQTVGGIILIVLGIKTMIIS